MTTPRVRLKFTVDVDHHRPGHFADNSSQDQRADYDRDVRTPLAELPHNEFFVKRTGPNAGGGVFGRRARRHLSLKCGWFRASVILAVVRVFGVGLTEDGLFHAVSKVIEARIRRQRSSRFSI